MAITNPHGLSKTTVTGVPESTRGERASRVRRLAAASIDLSVLVVPSLIGSLAEKMIPIYQATGSIPTWAASPSRRVHQSAETESSGSATQCCSGRYN